MINIHPQRWTDSPGPWLKELAWQNLKNIAKLLLIKIRRWSNGQFCDAKRSDWYFTWCREIVIGIFTAHPILLRASLGLVLWSPFFVITIRLWQVFTCLCRSNFILRRPVRVPLRMESLFFSLRRLFLKIHWSPLGWIIPRTRTYYLWGWWKNETYRWRGYCLQSGWGSHR